MLNERFFHLGKKYSAFLTVVTLLSSVSPSFSAPLVNAEETHKDDLLQFTSQNHIVGFKSDSVYIASTRHALTTKFLDANTVTPVSDGSSEVDSSGKVPALGTVTYKNLWNGIDAVYEGGKGVIVKSTYTVDTTKKGVTADNIRLQYNRPVHIDANGNLQINFEDGIMTEEAPIAWQETPEGRQPVAVSFDLQDEHTVGFSLGDYLPDFPVVIDPSLTWNTFLGGNGTGDVVRGLIVDASGNILVSGQSDATWGSPLRAYTSGYDGFVAKLNSNGTLIWHTFLGGSGTDYLTAIAIDTSANIIVSGLSSATWGSPVRAYTSGNDGLVAKLDSSGTLTWNTFLGGAGNEYMYALTVDTNANVLVGGQSTATWGSPVRAYTSSTDGLVAKLDSSGTLVWNTFLGGSSGDFMYGIAVDSSSNVYVGGYSSATWGSPIRAYTSSSDGYVAKLDTNGVLTWNTFLGGSGGDAIYAITIDTSGNVYVVGTSSATWGSPVRSYTSGDDGLVAKLDSSGTLAWNTFLGGSGTNSLHVVAVDTSGNIYVGGYSSATWGSPIRTYTLGDDGFSAKLDSGGTLSWNTFLGGSGSDYLWTLAIDTSVNVYIGGYSNATWGSPVGSYTSGFDAVVVKIDYSAPTVSTLSPADNATGVSRTANLVITFGEAIGKSGTGMVTIKKTSDNSTVETISVTGSLVTGSGTTTMTINPSVTLDYSTEYYVQIDAMAFPDASGNFYAGISDTTSWSFTTEAAPVVVEETPAPAVVQSRGGGRGSSAPGRGGSAPLIDPITHQISSNATYVSAIRSTVSSPGVILLENQKTKLLARIQKKLDAVLSLSVKKILEGTRERLLKRINERIARLLGQ